MSEYLALTGKEIREVMKRRTCEEIDKIPLLKASNSFHKAQMDFGFTIKAYPADVPVPEGEFSIVLKEGSLSKEELNGKVKNVDELREKVKRLEEQFNLAETICLEAKEALEKVYKEEQ